MKNKIVSFQNLIKISKLKRIQNKKIVLCHGVFDFPHLGHIKHFNAAKKFGDYLIVSLTEDKRVSKGANRPIYKEDQRVEFLSAFSMIDYIHIDRNSDATNIISTLKPTVYAKGQDYSISSNTDKSGIYQGDLTGNLFKEKIAAEKIGGKLVFTNEETFSSSKRSISVRNRAVGSAASSFRALKKLVVDVSDEF